MIPIELPNWLAGCLVGPGESSAKQKMMMMADLAGWLAGWQAGWLAGWLAPDHSPSPTQARPGQGEISAKKKTMMMPGRAQDLDSGDG